MKELILLVLVATAVVNGFTITYSGVPVDGYIELYSNSGELVYSGLVRSGVVGAPLDNASYAVLFISDRSVIALFNVVNSTSVEITRLPFTVNVSSNANVLVKLMFAFETEFRGNQTIYSDVVFNLVFPREFTQGSFKYVLKNITVNGQAIDSNVVSVNSSMDVYAYYDVVQEPLVLPLFIVLVVVVAVVGMSMFMSRRPLTMNTY